MPAVFASAKRMRKLTANAIGGKPVRARQEPDALRFEREIRVFPALAKTSTKNHCGHNAEASVRRVCGWNEVEDTVSPCPPSEDLEDLERNRRNDSDVGAAERLSSLERKKRAVLKFIGSCRYLAYGSLL